MMLIFSFSFEDYYVLAVCCASALYYLPVSPPTVANTYRASSDSSTVCLVSFHHGRKIGFGVASSHQIIFGLQDLEDIR